MLSFDYAPAMMKHNTEMLVSRYPDERNKIWVSFGRNHIVNLHELADIKPFRWGSPVWIEQAMQNWQSMAFSGYHVYPTTSWMWPNAMDRTEPALSVIDRDWIWIEAFGRYGWKPNRPAEAEKAYWEERLANKFGSAAAGAAIYNYLIDTGPVMPGFQNLVNIYNMNFFPTAVSEEATVNGIFHSQRSGDSGDSLARPLDEWLLEAYESRYGKLSPEVRRQPPLSVSESFRADAQGIQPLRLADVLVSMAEKSLPGLEAAKGSVTRHKDEFDHFADDNRCILHLARFYRAKVEAAIEKGKYEATGDFGNYDHMLEKLDLSVEEYRRLTDLATHNYRPATDMAEWNSWSATLKNFEDEAAFYHSQRILSTNGGDVVYLGLDGPMNNASNAYHWLLENGRQELNWSGQSYALGDGLFREAKLVVVYDMGSPQYQRHVAELQAWVEHGGRLLLWDVKANIGPPPFLEGIQFRNDSSHGAPYFVAFSESASPLLLHLSGTRHPLEARCGVAANIERLSSDWQELAYTVVASLNTDQIASGHATVRSTLDFPDGFGA